MTWFRVDDGFSDHAKVHSLQEGKHWKGALALWTLAGSWCAKHEKDGFVPLATIKRLGFAAAEADALVDAGLWEAGTGGYHFHQWGERNPLKVDLDERRHGVAERQRRHRSKPSNADVTRDRNDAQRAVTRSQTLPVPDPSQTLPERERARARPEPVDRLPEPEPGFTHRRMLAVFSAEFEAVQKTTPSLSGKQVGDLHPMVCRTASLQGADPEALFTDAVRAWLSNPLTDREQQSPLACFQARWGSLTARGASGPPPGEPETVEGLRAVGAAAAVRGDQAEVSRIFKRIQALEKRADEQVRRAR